MDGTTPQRFPKHRSRRHRASSPGATGPLREVRGRLALARWVAEALRRSALARVRRSRLLRWRHRAPIARELLLAPPDLRPVDPSFADEVSSGSMGLAGLTATLGDA